MVNIVRKRNGLVDISKIKIIEELYPRNSWSWQTAYSYAQAMSKGDVFPPIKVAMYNKQYVLVGGRHRLEASKQAQKGKKKRYIQAVIVSGLTREEIFQESVRDNIENGLPFSPLDKVQIVQKLQGMNVPMKKISDLVRIPMDKIERLLITRTTNTVSGKGITLKSPLKNMAGISVKDEVEDIQSHFTGASQLNTLNTLIDLIENNLIDWNNNAVAERFGYLRELMVGLVKKKRIVKKRTRRNEK